MMSATNIHSDSLASSILRRVARRLLRRPAPDMEAVEVAVIKQSDMFDDKWYLERYPDVARTGLDPVLHYVRHGAGEGRNPNTGFDTRYYLGHNPDVVATGMNPFRHYVEFGYKEKRAIRSQAEDKADDVPADQGVPSKKTGIEIIAESGVFNRDWYLRKYPDVAVAGKDPVLHYVKHGASEGRNPCALFDTRYYLKNNPDVATSGMNPLLHFCVHGHRELRNPSAAFDTTWYWLTHQAESNDESNPLAHYQAEGKQAAMDIRAAGNLSAEDKQVLGDICDRLLQHEEHDACTATRLGTALTRLSRWTDAEKAFGGAVALDWENPRAHERLAGVLAKQGKWWQVVESLRRATELDPVRPGWLYRLGEAQEKMNRFSEAAESYRSAIDLDPRHPNWHYRAGYALEKSEQPHKAKRAYAEAVERNKRKDVKRFGIGMLHQLRGYWPEAAKAYSRELERKPFDAELHFKLGMAHDRCYRWREAEQAYRDAIALKPDTPYWHYRYGFVLERQNRHAEAGEAYAAAATLSPKHMPYWLYRCGYVLEQAGEYERACQAYIQTRERQTLTGALYRPASAESALANMDRNSSAVQVIHGGTAPNCDSVVPKSSMNDEAGQRFDSYLASFPSEDLIVKAIAHDATDPHRHYQLGEVRERREDWDGAAKAYADAVARSNEYRPAWYYRLGFALFRTGHYEEACQAFRETRILRRAFGVDMAKYQKSTEQKVLMEYNEYLETLSVCRQHVLYESMHGTSVGGNPYAIFEHIIDAPTYANWFHIWVIAKGVGIPTQLRNRRNVVFVERQSDLYRRYLATASHLVSDVTFPYWFIRRPEQKYLNTWHGTPLKKLGKEIPGEFMVHGNVQRNLLQATHLISPNQHTSDTLIDSYDVRGIITAKLAETGYPRIDRTLNATREKCESIRGQLGLTSDKPVVLYAPTWRGIHGHAEFDIDRLQTDIAELVRLPCQLVFRGHHMVEDMLGGLSLPVVIAGQEVDTSDVLAIADILITDYSSIFFDFLPLKRPIFHYCYDWDEYAKKRGVSLDIQAMPGRVCKDLETLVTGLSQQLGATAEPHVYADALVRFCPYEDGGASERVADFFFMDDDRHVIDRHVDSRRSLLFFAGHFVPNGITASFLNLINGLVDLGQDRLSVILDEKRIRVEPTWKQKFDELPAEVGCLPRVGRMVQSPEEYWVGEKFGARRSLPTKTMWDVICGAYRREFTRLVGYARVDTVVNFEGYSGFWTATLGMGASPLRNISYLHNDMVEEYRVRHPYLTSLFGMHRYYDRLVSVSEHMTKVNQKKMGIEFGLSADLFTSCINTIDVTKIRRQATRQLDDDLLPWLEAHQCFLTMGRMSPEKDQAKLIEAFAQVHAEHPDTRLVVLGDGPLKQALEAKVAEIGLEDAIYLAGLRENPYPALSTCSCFVLPSNHEGQPMVLLEAMALRRPILATDIDGNRGVLGNQYGKLVHNSVKGLAAGMREFLSKETWPRNFNADMYQEKAIDAFRRTVSESTQSPPVLSKTCVIDSNKVVVAARADGLGERMNALLNAMFLAERLRFKFAFYWSKSGTWEAAGADRSHHAIVPEQEFFSRHFIESYSLESFSWKGFREVSGENVTSSDLLEPTTNPDFKGWLAPRIDMKGILSKELLPDDTLSLRDIFRRIGFSDPIEEAVNLADAVHVPLGCVSLHLRSGDIFYGPYRKWVHYSYKGITLPIAKAIINKIRSEGVDVLLFGQDNEVLEYLRHATGALLLEDLGNHSFPSPAARAMYELVIMSRCDYIVAGSSGFARQASLLGGVSIKQPREFFDHKEQTRISIEDLTRYGDQYHPLQTAFAYWYAYFYGRQFKSVEQASELLVKASHFDPDNQLYPIKLAACYFKARRFQEGDKVLRRLVNEEFAKYNTSKLPCFDVLVAKTSGKFNLAEDFEFFLDGARSGEPFCAAFHYVISRAANTDAGRALELFNDNRGDDVVLASLYQNWMSERCRA